MKVRTATVTEVRPTAKWGTRLSHPTFSVETCPNCAFPEADGGYCPECGWSTCSKGCLCQRKRN